MSAIDVQGRFLAADAEPHDASAGARDEILIVDDNPLVLALLKRLLEGEFRVAAFSTGEEAVNHVRRGTVSAVLSDIGMPGMSGLDLLRALRAEDPDLPVVLVTGAPTLESATQAIEYGVFRYISKPFDPEKLRATMHQASRLYRLARTKREVLELQGAPASERVALERQYRDAIESLWISFQPIVSMSSGRVFGYEALMRCDGGELSSPSQILNAAEQLDRLNEIGRLVRRRAGHALSEAPEGIHVFVNLHPGDLLDPELFDPAAPLTAVAERVVLEITERASLSGIRDVPERVAALRRLGFRIAIDDLGAGYAGLESFALLEPEIVKIDMSLTRAIDRSSVQQKLVGSLRALCQEMGMTIVCEGVETPEERDTLVALGCDLLQGYLFARPARAFPRPSF